MGTPNIGWKATRDYYKQVDFERIDESNFLERNRRLYGLGNHPHPSPFAEWEALKQVQTFELVTTDPGLLIGTGYPRGAGAEDEYKLALYFDASTGLPHVPGSSVKGVLRSVFPGRDRKNQSKHAPDSYKHIRYKAYADAKAAYIVQLVKKACDRVISEAAVERLELEMFEGAGLRNMYAHDHFLDAVPVNVDVKGAYKLLARDAITPHGKVPTKEPVPLNVLKVGAGVSYRFTFALQPSQQETGNLSVSDKLKLFEAILLDRGVGAKTTVSYGRLRRP